MPETNESVNLPGQGAQELARNIDAALAEPWHCYRWYDPDMEVTHRFQTAEQATAKMQEVGGTRFQHCSAGDLTMPVDCVDGQWWVRGKPLAMSNRGQPPAPADRPLASVQEAIDREALRSIEQRAILRAEVGACFKDDDRLAKADACAFRRIQDPNWRESAAVEIADNARRHPGYKASLDEFGRVTLPHGPLAASVYGLDAGHDRKIAAKEERKAAEFAAVAAGRADLIAFRVWPDGTVQSTEEGGPYSWMSDDFMLVEAPDEQSAGEKLQRIEAVSRLESLGGAAYTFWQVATLAMTGAPSAGRVDWEHVHRAVVLESVGRCGQEPKAVCAALCVHSPGAVTPEEQAALEPLVQQMAVEALAAHAERSRPEADRALG